MQNQSVTKLLVKNKNYDMLITNTVNKTTTRRFVLLVGIIKSVKKLVNFSCPCKKKKSEPPNIWCTPTFWGVSKRVHLLRVPHKEGFSRSTGIL